MTGDSMALQYVAVALAVALSAWTVMRKQFPGATRRLRVAFALPLLRDGRPSWSRALGRLIAPAPSRDGDACGGCDGCGPVKARNE